MRSLEQPGVSSRHSLSDRLPDDSFVLLDPAVEVLDTEIDEHRMLSHGYFEVGMVVPPGEGLLQFVTALSQQPVNLGALRAKFDDQEVIDKMLASLCQHGFLHGTAQTKPSAEELADLRGIAEQARSQTLRRSIVLDLDALLSIEQIAARLSAEGSAPE
ncbi:MAG: hypothetical protein QOE53_224, partial [Pseudonocardiales bacterium]|nr:hypothetical protein [Pseudonocardiales bacterium]